MPRFRFAPMTLLVGLFLSPALWAVPDGQKHDFRGTPDGAQPQGGLVSDGAENFYGTTVFGGVAGCGPYAGSCGMVFKMARDNSGKWQGTVVYKFKGTPDGEFPYGNLVFDSLGNLYGTTNGGGKNGGGTAFELSPNQNGAWTESILYSFESGAGNPETGLVFDSQGDLYGASLFGGAAGRGFVFELIPSGGGQWSEETLYTFAGGLDGEYPSALILDVEGNVYGTTPSGGAMTASCSIGCGTVFELSPSQGGSWSKTVLYSFNDGLDGGYPTRTVRLSLTLPAIFSVKPRMADRSHALWRGI
jgi:hypothetical protein